MLRRWRLAAAITGATVVAAGILAFVLGPIYRSEALIVPAADSLGVDGATTLSGGLGSLANLAGVSLGGSRQGAEALALLKSRSVLERLVEDQHLLQSLFADRWDRQAASWRAGSAAPSMADAIKLLRSSVFEIREDAKSGVITVRCDWGDRFAAAKWANRLIEIVNEEMRSRTIRDAESSLSALTKQLRSADSVELRSALSRLMESQLRSMTLAQVRREYAFSVIDQAVVADANKRVKPARRVMLVLGLLIGVSLSAAVVAIAELSGNIRSGGVLRKSV
jgi:uncharacterized protein involved in exopolysaccharide biosynthesis